MRLSGKTAFCTASGAGIPIEQRPSAEVTHVGGVRHVPEGVGVRNPSFDVTPAELVTALITEKGVVHAPDYASPAVFVAEHRAGLACTSLAHDEIRAALERIRHAVEADERRVADQRHGDIAACQLLGVNLLHLSSDAGHA